MTGGRLPASEFRAQATSEADFTAAVVELAQWCGWRTVHFRPARTGRGWRTAVQGNGIGWPDLFAVRGHRVLAAELKVKSNKPTAAQAAWLAALAGAGVEVHVWRPADWDELVKVLR